MALKRGSSRYLRAGYLASTEQVLFETHPSKWFYFPGPLAALVVLAIGDYVTASVAYPKLWSVPWITGWVGRLVPSKFASLPDPRILLLSGFALLTLGALIWTFVRLGEWVMDTYVVTDDRIIEQKGILRTVNQEIPLHQIRDVNVLQNSLGSRSLRYGTIRFKSLSEQDFPNETPQEAMVRHHGRPLPKSGFPNPASVDIYDPRDPVAKSTGIEWWVGVPNPLRIERTVEEALRAPMEDHTVPPARYGGAHAPGNAS
jgi:Bacterial PH domain